MKNPHIVITAGPTFEPIDPVRGITNRSTGIMGYEIAKEAIKRGYKVTLITGPTGIKPPDGAKVIRVETTAEMRKAVLNSVNKENCLIMAAAVSDFRIRKQAKHKVKKKGAITLRLVRNPDILKAVLRKNVKIKVGFALESRDLINEAKKKLRDKGLDLVVANKIEKKNMPFGNGKKNFVLLSKKGEPVTLKNVAKSQASRAILDTVKKLML